jgi:excisionase family DNA binding protein
MIDPLSIAEAARSLDLSDARVRAMASRGQLPATKIGDRWLVERKAVEQRRKEKPLSGRRFTPRNAWAILLLCSGEEALKLDPSVRSRLRRALGLEGLGALAPRLRERGRLSLYKAHSGETPYLLEDEALMRSGISAASSMKLGLLAGREADGYIAESRLRRFIDQHALSPGGVDGNVRLRVVPDEVWAELDGRPLAPVAAVALDLADEPDSRSEAAGKKLIRRLEREYRVRVKGGSR